MNSYFTKPFPIATIHTTGRWRIQRLSSLCCGSEVTVTLGPYSLAIWPLYNITFDRTAIYWGRPSCWNNRTTMWTCPWANPGIRTLRYLEARESPLVSLAFLFAHATTTFVLLATCLLFASPDITIHSYLNLFPTVQHLHIRSRLWKVMFHDWMIGSKHIKIMYCFYRPASHQRWWPQSSITLLQKTHNSLIILVT